MGAWFPQVCWSASAGNPSSSPRFSDVDSPCCQQGLCPALGAHHLGTAAAEQFVVANPRRASCLYEPPRVWRWGGAGSLFVGEVFGVHTRGFIEFAEVAFSISSASPPWAYGRCSDGLGEGLTAQTPGLLA